MNTIYADKKTIIFGKFKVIPGLFLILWYLLLWDTAFSGYKGTNELKISKINAALPIITTNTADPNKIHDLLDFGVVLYPNSARFGQIGQTILLGHSAPSYWPKIKHDTAFSRISELIPGDLINIEYQEKTYHYSVIGFQIVDKGSVLADKKNPVNSLALVSCWPPGHDRQRIIIEASLIFEK